MAKINEHNAQSLGQPPSPFGSIPLPSLWGYPVREARSPQRSLESTSETSTAEAQLNARLPPGLSLHVARSRSRSPHVQGPIIADGLYAPAIPYLSELVSDLTHVHGLPVTLATVMALRGFRAGEAARRFLSPNLSRDLPEVWTLPGADALCQKLTTIFKRRAPIAICHDYDVDGIMSGVVLARGLRALGLTVTLNAPCRFDDGFGPNQGLTHKAHIEGAQLLIWVDFGTTHRHAFPAQYHSHMDLWVCDHHIPTDSNEQPNGIITNPWVAPDAEAWRGLCAAPLAWNMLRAIYDAAESGAWGREVQSRANNFDIDALLPYVAAAAISDVTELQGSNRAIVWHGIKHAKACQDPGFRALCNALGCDAPTAEDFAFKFGPTINAKPRICGKETDGTSPAEQISRFLAAESLERAETFAHSLTTINQYRKQIERQGLTELRALIRENGEGVYQSERGLVVASRHFNPGVVGLLAAREADKRGIPVWVFRILEDGSWRGSARSVEGFHIEHATKTLSEFCSTFGGHDAAAGATLLPGKGPEFAHSFLTLCQHSPSALPHYREVHAEFNASLEFVRSCGPAFEEELLPLEPCGRGNPPVHLLVEGFRPTYAVVLKDMHLALIGDSKGTRVNAYFFHCTDHPALTATRYNSVYGEELPVNEDPRGARLACRPFQGALRDDVSQSESLVLIAAAESHAAGE